MNKRGFSWLAAVFTVAAGAAILLVVAGCGGGGGGANSTSSTSSARIIDGTTGTVVNIDPANEYDYDSFTVDLNIFQGLYGFPSGAKLAPVLATGCNHSADLQTWTCELRHDVKFSNGDPMTSADVKYSFDRVQKIKGDQGIYTLLSDLKRTTVTGKYTVIFHRKSPFSVWPYMLSSSAG